MKRKGDRRLEPPFAPMDTHPVILFPPSLLSHSTPFFSYSSSHHSASRIVDDSPARYSHGHPYSNGAHGCGRKVHKIKSKTKRLRGYMKHHCELIAVWLTFGFVGSGTCPSKNSTCTNNSLARNFLKKLSRDTKSGNKMNNKFGINVIIKETLVIWRHWRWENIDKRKARLSSSTFEWASNNEHTSKFNNSTDFSIKYHFYRISYEHPVQFAYDDALLTLKSLVNDILWCSNNCIMRIAIVANLNISKKMRQIVKRTDRTDVTDRRMKYIYSFFCTLSIMWWGLIFFKVRADLATLV
jgi:hypothetical protein